MAVRVLSKNGLIGEYDDVTQLAVDSERRVVAVGKSAAEEAQMPGAELVRLFHHPRVAIHDVEITGKLLQWFVRKATDNRVLHRPDAVIWHTLDVWEGGLSDVEMRGFIDAARLSGFSNAAVCCYPEVLTDSQIWQNRNAVR
jgi:rod shape-determining protein MreB